MSIKTLPISKTNPQLRSACEVMDSTYEQPLSVEAIASHAGFSHFHFIRFFHRTYGITPHQYLTRKRIQQAQRLLATSKLSVTEICFAVGFQSLGSFSTLYHRQTGYAPSEHRTRLQEQQKRLQLAAPACFLFTYGAIEQFSRSE
ncbi:MAG: AraC family transcriptional regulator [Chloroflexota bacterium]